MRSRGRRSGGGTPAPLLWTAWGLGLLVLFSSFVPFSPGLTRGLSWIVSLFAVFECGISIGRSRQGAFLAYAATAVLMNPFVPFHFPMQAWRLIYAGIGLWVLADHLPGQD